MVSSELEPLVKMAYDSNPAIRKYAAERLVEFADELAYQILLELANDKDESVKETAKRSIEIFKEKHADKMQKPLSDKLPAIISGNQQQETTEPRTPIYFETVDTRESHQKEERREFNLFEYVYSSLDRYRERPEVMKKHFENLRDYITKEMNLIYELIQSEDSFDITKIKNKMKIMNTGELKVKDKVLKEFVEKKNRRKIKMYRLLVEDKYGREGIVYVYESAAKEITQGDVIKIINCEARSIVGTDETAIWVWKEESEIWKRI
ncbi:MAG: HEAT repeat domain-containing protein [Candidatus Anstonellales archaeon]